MKSLYKCLSSFFDKKDHSRSQWIFKYFDRDLLENQKKMEMNVRNENEHKDEKKMKKKDENEEEEKAAQAERLAAMNNA